MSTPCQAFFFVLTSRRHAVAHLVSSLIEMYDAFVDETLLIELFQPKTENAAPAFIRYSSGKHFHNNYLGREAFESISWERNFYN